jgi:hypothetical protein
MQDMPDKQTLSVAALYSVAFGGALALCALLATPAKALGPAGMPVLMALVAVWGLTFAGMAWKRTDEAAREAHKFAALWGAPFALLALLVGLPIVAVTVFHAKLQPGLSHLDQSPWSLVMAGVMLSGVVQSLGYTVAWAGWWVRRR